MASRDAHDALVELVRGRLRDRGVAFEEREDSRTFVLGPGTTLNLDNLAAKAAAAPREAWPALVDEVLRPVLMPVEDITDDPDELRGMVRARLQHPQVLAGAGISHLSRPWGEDLIEVLVVDTPTEVQTPDAATFAPLGLDDEELFALGRQNLRTHEPARMEPLEAGGARLLLAEGESFFTASWAMLVDELTEPGPHGLLLGAPDRHVLLAAPVDGVATVEAVNALVGITLQRFEQSPGNLSPHLYWWRDGVVTRQPIGQGEDGRIGFYPTEELVGVLGQ